MRVGAVVVNFPLASSKVHFPALPLTTPVSLGKALTISALMGDGGRWPPFTSPRPALYLADCVDP